MLVFLARQFWDSVLRLARLAQPETGGSVV